MRKTVTAASLVVAIVGCRHAPPQEPPQVLEGTYLVGARLPVRAIAGGRVLGTTTCGGPTAILAREATGTRVRAFAPSGVFLAEGMIDDADLARSVGSKTEREACDGGIVVVRSETIPERASLALTPPILTKVDRSATWNGEGEIFQGADCARSSAEGTSLKEEDDLPDEHVDRTWGLALEDGDRHVRLTGPTEVRKKRDAAPVSDSYLCLRDFAIVGKIGPTVLVLRAGACLASVLPVAYDPSDAVRWYRSRDACLRENPKPSPQIAAELALRHGCS